MKFTIIILKIFCLAAEANDLKFSEWVFLDGLRAGSEDGYSGVFVPSIPSCIHTMLAASPNLKT